MQPYLPPPQVSSTAPMVVATAQPTDRVTQHWELFFEQFPHITLTPTTLKAQAGPAKPNFPSLPKPTDPPAATTPRPMAMPDQEVSVQADRQEFDLKTNTFSATGNVVVRYQGSELKADRVTLVLGTQLTTAEGNVFFTRGEQKVQGTRLEYNYGNRQGKLLGARGTANLGSIGKPPESLTTADITSGSVTLALGGETRVQRQGVRRLGFIADEIRLNDDRWEGTNVRVTNDPFSPPELEIVTPKATLTPISPTQDVLELESPTLVFDRLFGVPLPINRITLDNFERGLPVFVGFDRQDRGGLFYQQNFDLINRPDLRFQVSPQLFVQRSLQSNNLLNANIIGVVSRLESILPDGQYLGGRASLASLDLGDFGNQFRGFVNYSRPVLENHTFTAQYAYRERFFNGSLGFQDVQNSLGVSLFSPNFVLGDSGINVKYQSAIQIVDADRAGTPAAFREALVKHESAIALNRYFPLWRGTPLPAEPNQGLRYAAEPITPGVDAIVGITGAYSLYSSGDTRGFLTGTIGLSTTLGNYARSFFDYTKIDLSFSQTEQLGASPFFFDRIADRQVVTAGIKQQIFGPLRIGYQQSWNPSTGNTTDSLYTVELERRTYAVILRYNPSRETGEIFLRISDFNWNNPPSEISGKSTP